MWIARDKDETLWLYTYQKPKRDKLRLGDGIIEFWTGNDGECDDFEGRNGIPINRTDIDASLFDKLKWEDEPLEIDVVIKNPLYGKKTVNEHEL